MICSKKQSLVSSRGPLIFLVLPEPPTLQPRVLTISIMQAYIYYLLLFYLIKGGRDILFDIETGWLGDRTTVGKKVSVQTGIGAHPASCTIGTGLRSSDYNTARSGNSLPTFRDSLSGPIKGKPFLRRASMTLDGTDSLSPNVGK
jgi:hypothetical protein